MSGASSEVMGLGQGGGHVAQLLPATRQRCRQGQCRLGRGQIHPGVLPWAWWQGGAWGMVMPCQGCPMGSLTSPSCRVASNLDGSLKGQYQVTVEAQDREAPVHTAQTVLNVSVTPAPPSRDALWPAQPCSPLLSPHRSLQ